MVTRTVCCPACDHEHECAVVRGEHPDDDYTDIPDHCEACGEILLVGESDYREDFHADC